MLILALPFSGGCAFLTSHHGVTACGWNQVLGAENLRICVYAACRLRGQGQSSQVLESRPSFWGFLLTMYSVISGIIYILFAKSSLEIQPGSLNLLVALIE